MQKTARSTSYTPNQRSVSLPNHRHNTRHKQYCCTLITGGQESASARIWIRKPRCAQQTLNTKHNRKRGTRVERMLVPLATAEKILRHLPLAVSAHVRIPGFVFIAAILGISHDGTHRAWGDVARAAKQSTAMLRAFESATGP